MFPEGATRWGASFTIQPPRTVINDDVALVNGADFPVRVEKVRIGENAPAFEIVEVLLPSRAQRFPDQGRTPDWSFYSLEELRDAGLPAAVGEVLKPGEGRKLVLALNVTANDAGRSRLKDVYVTFSSRRGLTEDVLRYQLDVCHGPGGPCDAVDEHP